MRYELPNNHNLSDVMAKNLVFKSDEGKPSLSNIQYRALQSGIGRGESILVVAPTSTGKTQIGLRDVLEIVTELHHHSPDYKGS